MASFLNHQNVTPAPYSVRLVPMAVWSENVITLGYFQQSSEVPSYPHVRSSGYRVDDSWVLNANEDRDDHTSMADYDNELWDQSSNNHDQFQGDSDSWVLDAQEVDEDGNGEELGVWNLHDHDDDFVDPGRTDDALSGQTITKYLKTRSCDQEVDDRMCVVCRDRLFQKHEKIGTLDCGHEYHAGCIREWLMNKNCCPLCKATGIRPESS